MLKYTFTAEFKDGTIYEQNVEDRSTLEPNKRSCFFDIKERLGELKTFTLKGDGKTFLVDLTDGHFEVNGIAFSMHEVEDKSVDPMSVVANLQLKDFRLVYFQSNTKTFNTKIVGGQLVPAQETGHYKVFRFGWQCTIDGKNYQQIMQVA